MDEEALTLHRSAPSERVYAPYAVNLLDIRKILEELATEATAKSWSRIRLHSLVTKTLRPKIGGCRAVEVSEDKGRIYIGTHGKDGTLYQYMAALPPNWPKY